MNYMVLADLMLVVHLLFIGFVIFGGLLALRFAWVALVHLPAACWGAYIELSGGLCPLTGLENRFLVAAGDAGYGETFVEHYLLPVIYPAALTRGVQFRLAVLVIGLNAAIYAYFAYARRFRRPRR
jgi:uncharacterized protein DUF2784